LRQAIRRVDADHSKGWGVAGPGEVCRGDRVRQLEVELPSAGRWAGGGGRRGERWRLGGASVVGGEA